MNQVKSHRMPRNAATPRKPPGGRRLGATEVLRRGRAIEEMLALGMNREQLLTECERKFKMAPRTVDDYVERIKAAWSEDAAKTRPERREATRARLLRLREDLKRWRAGGPLVALERLLCDIDGTKEPETVHVETNVPPGAIALPELTYEQSVEALVDAMGLMPYLLEKREVVPTESMRRTAYTFAKKVGLNVEEPSDWTWNGGVTCLP